ncbi:AAA family ATPase [Butyrivibrio sp. XPD2002]|uniref:AAA family ATPase n=1 Tax=Butyrivibrio sp. XPD2002 TaxID=1280665 RepID=UPI000412BD18|nr:AAA family ATPase [Butyrivibrio sp. XPD2002]
MRDGLNVLTHDQQRAMQVLNSGLNVFLSGTAGTGKSFLINEFIKGKKNKNVILCAPTGEAAERNGEEDLQKIFEMPDRILRVGEYNVDPSQRLDQADIIIIDDINSCRVDMFEYAIRTLQFISNLKELASSYDHADKQIILVGDFYRQPPKIAEEYRSQFISEWGVKRGEDRFAFNSSLWDELLLANVILKARIKKDEVPEYMERVNLIKTCYEAGTDLYMYDQTLRTTKVVFDFYEGIAIRNYPNVDRLRQVNAKTYIDWNDAEDDELRDEWAMGVGIDEIAKAHDRTVGAIRSRLLKIS